MSSFSYLEPTGPPMTGGGSDLEWDLPGQQRAGRVCKESGAQTGDTFGRQCAGATCSSRHRSALQAMGAFRGHLHTAAKCPRGGHFARWLQSHSKSIASKNFQSNSYFPFTSSHRKTTHMSTHICLFHVERWPTPKVSSPPGEWPSPRSLLSGDCQVFCLQKGSIWVDSCPCLCWCSWFYSLIRPWKVSQVREMSLHPHAPVRISPLQGRLPH